MQVLVRSGGNRGAARLVDVDRDETVAAIKPRLLGVEPGHRTDDCWRVVHGSCYLDDERRLREYPQIRTGSTLELRGAFPIVLETAPSRPCGEVAGP